MIGTISYVKIIVVCFATEETKVRKISEETWDQLKVM